MKQLSKMRNIAKIAAILGVAPIVFLTGGEYLCENVAARGTIPQEALLQLTDPYFEYSRRSIREQDDVYLHAVGAASYECSIAENKAEKIFWKGLILDGLSWIQARIVETPDLIKPYAEILLIIANQNPGEFSREIRNIIGIGEHENIVDSLINRIPAAKIRGTATGKTASGYGKWEEAPPEHLSEFVGHHTQKWKEAIAYDGNIAICYYANAKPILYISGASPYYNKSLSLALNARCLVDVLGFDKEKFVFSTNLLIIAFNKLMSQENREKAADLFYQNHKEHISKELYDAVKAALLNPEKIPHVSSIMKNLFAPYEAAVKKYYKTKNVEDEKQAYHTEVLILDDIAKGKLKFPKVLFSKQCMCPSCETRLVLESTKYTTEGPVVVISCEVWKKDTEILERHDPTSLVRKVFVG